MNYSIMYTPCYSTGTCNAPQESMLTEMEKDRDGDSWNDGIAEWDTLLEAQKWIDEEIKGTYYLSHGEMGRPTYTIIDNDKGDNKTDCFDQGTTINPKDIPSDIRNELDSTNVMYSYSDGDIDCYRECVTRDGIRWTISYYPRSIAIQRYADDLGCLEWAYPDYNREEE